MRPSEDIHSVTYMKQRAADLLRDVRENRRPVVITQNGEASAVVLDVASYEALRDANLLMRVLADSERAIRGGKTKKQAAVFRRIEARFFRAGRKKRDARKSGRKKR